LRILFLITARGGSRGVPGKNLRRLAGRSLVAFKAIAARKSRHCTRLIVSSDSLDIQDEARRYGAEVPFTRPQELASDTAASADVVWHAMQWIEAEGGPAFDALMLLEPSAPFTRPLDYDRAVELMDARSADVVVGMREMDVSSRFVGPMAQDGSIAEIVTRIKNLASLRRQDFPLEYTMNGALYLVRWEFFRHHRGFYRDPARTYGYPMPPEYSLEIDSLADLRYAEFLVERGYIDLSPWSEDPAGERSER
jgi:CMP-N,N'-diacetyllegionaminic acid synthase